MKKILLPVLLLPLLVNAKTISVSSVSNSCAPTDGHAIYFGFKDDLERSLNITAWNFTGHGWIQSSSPQAQKEFIFNIKGASDGVMNICITQDNKSQCKLENGHIQLNEPVLSFKEGQVVQGDVFYDFPEKFQFHFKTTVLKNPATICG